ncbi:MAG: response regulator [Armatimonadota bacterium]
MPIRVLLADDHAMVREGLRMILEAQPDMSVVGEAANGREAVRLASELKPDVVIMDIAMPELNGIDATQSIIESTGGSKVVILSMHLSSEYVARALRAGALGYLLKASASMTLVEAVRSVARGQRYLCQRVKDNLIDDYLDRYSNEQQKSPIERLSAREREVLQLITEGKSTSEIAEQLSLAPSTVDTYRSRIMQKLGLSDLSGLVKFAIRHGITTA